MCQYLPYTHTCGHGTAENPARYLLEPCQTPPKSRDTLCTVPNVLHRLIATGSPCWTCHKKRMSEFSMTPNIWKYLMILQDLALPFPGHGAEDMIPELRHYYTLMNAVHKYDINNNEKPAKFNRQNNTEGDERNSPGYWNNGIADLLKLVGFPGNVGSANKDEGTEDTLVSMGAGGGRPQKSFAKQPVMSVDGFTFHGENGEMVEMIETVSDNGHEGQDIAV